MKVNDSAKAKELRNHLLILLGLVLAVFISSTYSTSSESQGELIQKETEVAIPLWCFDSEAGSLWRSVVKKGCGFDESLGAGKIFLYVSIFVIACGILLIALNKKLMKMMHGVR
jgi:uncharacterized membrane protein